MLAKIAARNLFYLRNSLWRSSPNGHPDLWGGGLFAFASEVHFWSDGNTGVDPTHSLTLTLNLTLTLTMTPTRNQNGP